MKTDKSRKVERLDAPEIKRFQLILEAQREQALRSLSRLEDETRSVDSNYPQDMADLCVTSLSKESLFQQSGERRLMLRMIEAALARIQHGTFGVCAACGDGINRRRLDALPWTRFCLRCQQASEQGHEIDYPSVSDDQPMALRKAG
jgi:RNA polymerase-binding transcription factor